MSWVIQRKSRWKDFKNERACEIEYRGNTLEGICADATLEDPVCPLDCGKRGEETTVFFQQGSLKLYAPNPPFNGNEGLSDVQQEIVDNMLNEKVREYVDAYLNNR